jgi:hypothetical protein
VLDEVIHRSQKKEYDAHKRKVVSVIIRDSHMHGSMEDAAPPFAAFLKETNSLKRPPHMRDGHGVQEGQVSLSTPVELQSYKGAFTL